MAKEQDNSISFGMGILAGVVAGVVAGILYSPKSGEYMRKDIKNAAGQLTTTVPSDVQAAKEAGCNMIDKIKIKLEKQMNKIQNTIKAGKLAQAKKKEEAEAGIDY